MSRLPKPRYSHNFLLDPDIALMLTERAGIEGTSKTDIVEKAIREYCYKYKAALLEEIEKEDNND